MHLQEVTLHKAKILITSTVHDQIEPPSLIENFESSTGILLHRRGIAFDTILLLL